MKKPFYMIEKLEVNHVINEGLKVIDDLNQK
jgi:hypothetical protein